MLPDNSNSCPFSWWCHPTISSSIVPFSSRLQSFPASGSFPVSQFFVPGGQSIGASALVLPMGIQDWFPLGRTGWISLQTKGFSRVFSNTTVQNHQFFMHSLPYSHKMQRLLEIWPNKPQLPWILRNVALQVECYHCVWCWVRSRKLAKAHPLCKFQGHVLQTLKTHAFFYFFLFLLFFLYNTVLVLPYINMNPPRVYMSSQTWTPLPPPTPYDLSGSSPCMKSSAFIYCYLKIK